MDLVARANALSKQVSSVIGMRRLLWSVSIAKPPLSPLRLENSNKRNKVTTSASSTLESPHLCRPLAVRNISDFRATPRLSKDLKVQVLLFKQLEVTLQKDNKGSDEKDSLLAKVQVTNSGTRNKDEAFRPKRRRKVKPARSPSSTLSRVGRKRNLVALRMRTTAWW